MTRLNRMGQTPYTEFRTLPPDGRRRVVRHGFGPERSIQTGIGAIDVRRPKVRDRATDVPADEKARFTSNILPKWARRSRLVHGCQSCFRFI